MKRKLEKSNVQEIYELNQVQKGMLYHFLKEPGNNLYNVQLSFSIEGQLDISLLQQAFACLQSGNEALRSVFTWEKIDKPLQVVLKDCPLEYSFHDISGFPEEDISKLVTEQSAESRAKRFDLTELPVRIQVIRTRRLSYVLNITHHHILYDGWSSGVLLKELFYYYRQLKQGENVALIAKPGYKDLQLSVSKNNFPGKAKDYWLQYLNEYEPTSFLSANDPQITGEDVRKIHFAIPGSRLEKFVKEHKVTKAAFIYAAYGILLQKYNNASDVVFGSTVSSRDVMAGGNEAVIGNFINTIPLRVKDIGEMTVAHVVTGVNVELLTRSQFHSSSYSAIKELVGLKPAEDLFDSVLVVENYPVDEGLADSTGLAIKLRSFYENTGIPLVITVFFKTNLEIELVYKPGSLEPEQAERLGDHFIKVIDAMLENSSATVRSISLLSKKEKQQLLEFNDTKADYPSEETIVSLFEKQVEKTPHNIAVRYDKTILDYRQLNDLADKIASYLRQVKDVQTGDLVGLLLPRNEYLLPVIFGILKAGAAYVPISTDYPAERIQAIIDDAGLKTLITEDNYNTNTRYLNSRFVDLTEMIVTINQLSFKKEKTGLTSTHLAYVIYTSGSTGKPKGVMVQHHSVINRLCWMQKAYPLSPDDVLLQKTPVVFDVSVWELFWWSFTGASLFVTEPGDEKEPKKIIETIKKQAVTTLHFVPSMLAAFIHALDATGDYSALKSLRRVFASGEALKAEQVNAFGKSINAPNHTRLINLYGPTEATVDVSFYECIFDKETTKVPIGKPIDNINLHILDKWNQFAPIGMPGELCIAGVGLAQGYLNNQRLTDEKFIINPHNGVERIYRTGDLAKWLPDGNIEFLGRIDNQVKIHGHRIEPGEIENRLATHDQVNECAVVVVQKEEDKVLVAYYVSAVEIDATVFRNYLAAKLPEYMVPAYYIRMEKLPLTLNGKLNRKALPAPEIKAAKDHISPKNTTEEKLVELWAEILKIDKAVISVNQSFFELGGHSLRAMTLANRITREFGVEISLRRLFDHDDISRLAGIIREADHSSASSVQKTVTRESYKLSSAQKRLYFLYELDRSSLAYNMPYVIKLEGVEDRQRLEEVFNKLIRRHESLRTCFIVNDNEIVQKVSDQFNFEIEYYRSNGDQEQLIKNFIRPFDLAVAPLIRAGLIAVAKDEHILLVDMHHIINDGVSKEIFLRDFMSLYNNEALPALELQYKDFAAWQQSADQQLKIAEQKSFWLNEFSEEPAIPELPVDFTRPAIKSNEGNSLRFQLSESETNQLKAIAEKEDSTLFMVILSVYNILLAKLSNQDDIVIGTPVAGRQHADFAGIIGLFLNTLPLRNHPKSHLSFRDFLSSLKLRTLAGFDNQAYPYEELIDELHIERDASRNPLFDVLFMFQNFEDSFFSIPGLKITPYEYVHPVAKADLTLLAEETNRQLVFSFEYATSLFRQETIERFIVYFKRIVSAIIADTTIKVAEIDVLPEEEKHRLLNEFNDTTAQSNEKDTVISLFEKQVKKSPDKVALIYEDKRLTYEELNAQANRLAWQLRNEYDTRPNHFVGLMVGRSENLVIGMLGILKSGAAYVPIDPSYPKERIEYILADSRIDVLLSDKELDKGFSYAGKVVHPIAPAEYSSYVADADQQSIPGDLCYMIHTSGSTGNPKGVMISHNNVVNFFAGMDEKLPVQDTGSLLAITSTSFDISVLELLWTLCTGIEVVLHPSDVSLSGLDRYIGEDLSVDFSLFFFSSYNSKEKEKYKLLLESVKYADQQGFKAVWTPERHFHEFGGLYPNPSVISSALAMITEQIELRSGSVVSPLHDVLRIAEEWAVVDNLSGGRVGLSFASGWNPNDFALGDGNYKDRHKTMYGQIETIKKLWKGERIKRKNGVGKEVELNVFPSPVQSELPVWITSAGSPETFKTAGAIGANLLTHFLGQDVAMLAENIKLYRQSREAAGYDKGKVTIMVHTYIGENIEEVERLVQQPFIDYLKSSIGLSKVIFEEAGFKEEDLSDELKDKILLNSFQRYYKTSSLIGTKSSCSRTVQQLKAIGIDEIACLVDFGVEESKVMEGLKHLNELKQVFTFSANNRNKPVTMMQSTPSFIKLLQEDQGSRKFLNSLQLLLVGGEAVPLSLVQQIKKDNNKVRLYNMYGPTETTVWSCVNELEENIVKVSIGKPIRNTQIYILDKDHKLVPAGVPGELYIGGEGLSRGYWNKQELTSERFVPNPFNPDEKIYNTGDIARWLSGGELEYMGRKDQQVKIRGFRIELGEIENCMLTAEGVKEAVVVAKENEEGNKILAGYVVADPLLDITALRSHLSKTLPYYMVPSFFVVLDKFPLTPNGKLDRKRLPDPVMESVLEYVAPQSKEEQLLADVWSHVLGIKKTGVTDNFFSLGGDSIKSIQIISRLQTAGYELSVKDIFTTQTIRELALRMKRTTALADQSLVTGKSALTPVQCWFFEGPVINKGHYNQSVVLEFPGGITRQTVEKVFAKLQEHHDALRMVFKEEHGAMIAETKGLELPVWLEEYELPVTNKEEFFISACNKIQSGIELSSGPLMRLGLFNGEKSSRLLIVVHHLVMDGISWRILFEDIDRLYGQVKKQETLSLPLKTDAFKLWAAHLEEYTKTKAFEKAKAYWKAAADKQVRTVKRDYPDGDHVLSDSRSASFRLNKEYTSRLLKEVHTAFGTQINDILLTALLIGVKRQYGNVAVTMDLEGHGREEIGQKVNISRTIGWFTSIYPVVLQSEGESLAETIKQVKETLAHVPNKGIDYLLQQQAGGTVQSQVFFNYLGQFDSGNENQPYSIGYEGTGDRISLKEISAHDWDILGILANGELQLTLRYSEKQYKQETADALMRRYKESLIELIEYCCSSRKSILTPSDLTCKDLSIAQLNELQDKYEVEDVYSLSPLQEGMLFHTLLNPDAEGYFLQMTYRLQGDLDIPAVEKSLNDLLSRYDVLRTVFLHDKYDRALQVVLKKRKADFTYEDVREECLKASKEEVIQLYQSRDRARKFDPARDVLMRVTVLQTGEDEFEFIWSYHHIIMDGWCIGIIVQDFKEIYAENRRGRTISLPPVKPYSRYIEWMENRDKDQSIQYWNNYLDSYDSLASLPKKKTSPAGKIEYTHASHQLVIEASKTESLLKICGKYGVTLNVILQAAWGILLAKYNNADDVVFGSVVSGRPAEMEGVERMVGLFINTIPVRVKFDSADTFNQLMLRMLDNVLESQPHHYSLLSEIQSLTVLGRDLLDHIMVVENFPITGRIEGEGTIDDSKKEKYTVSDVRVIDRNNYDLSLIIIPGKEIHIMVEYNAVRYEEYIMQGVLSHLNEIIEQVIADTQVRVKEIELVTEKEKKTLLYDFNQTAVAYPAGETVISLFEKQAARTPDNIALVHGQTRVSYRQLNAMANKVAQKILQTLPEGKHKIGLLFNASVEMIGSIWGVLKAGCTYVPVSPKGPFERNQYIVSDAGILLLLTQQEHLDAGAGDLVGIEKTFVIEYTGEQGAETENPGLVILPEDSINVIYTSGTEGRPKGVEVLHKGIYNYTKWRVSRYNLTAMDVLLQTMSYSFDAYGTNLYSSLVTGSCLVLVDEKELMRSEVIENLIRTEKVTSITSTPAIHNLILNEIQNKKDLAHVRHLGVGGEKIRPDLVKQSYHIFPNSSFFNEYGPTETTIASTNYEIVNPDELLRNEELPDILIGKPINNTVVYILDKNNKLQPAGVAGELCIGGDGVAKGYCNDPALTNEKFVSNPYKKEERIYRTGDLARWLPDGNIDFLGRINSQVKIRGFRIELTEIEKQLNTYSLVKESVVIMKEEERDKYLIAYYVSDSQIAGSEIISYLAERLPDYMIPAYYVHLESMPLTTNGKINTKALPDHKHEAVVETAGPSNEMERTMIEIWAEVLEIDKEMISVTKSFFEMGGHSLKAVQLINKINKRFDIEVTLEDIFDKESIKNLSDYLVTVSQLAGEPVSEKQTIEVAI